MRGERYVANAGGYREPMKYAEPARDEPIDK